MHSLASGAAALIIAPQFFERGSPVARQRCQVFVVGYGLRLASHGLPLSVGPTPTRNIFSIFRPFANSSTNLSKYLTCCVNGFSISSTR